MSFVVRRIKSIRMWSTLRVVSATVFLSAGFVTAEFYIPGNLLSSGSFENTTIEQLDATWDFSPAGAWRIDDRQVVDGIHSLAVTASTNKPVASAKLSRPARSSGDIVFGGWISLKGSAVGRNALVRMTCTAEPSGPPGTAFFVPDESDYYAVSREFRADTQPTYFEHRFSVPVSYKSLTLSLSIDTGVGDVYFDQLFIKEGTNTLANWVVEKQTEPSPAVWRAGTNVEYRISARAPTAASNDVLWADVDFARFFFAYGERSPLNRGSVQVWAISTNRAERLAAVSDDALPTLEDHYQHNGLVRWRAKDWAERYEIYFSPAGKNGDSSEPEPVTLDVGEMLSYAPERQSPAWGGWPGAMLEVMDADGDGDWDLYPGTSDEGYYICRNIGSNTSPLFAPRSRLLPTDKAPSSARAAAWMDWDGDGDNDRMSGVKEALGTYINGANLRFSFNLNTGSSLASSTRVVDTGGNEIVLSDATWFLIDVGDFDNDGKPDLVVGTAMGTLDLLLNRGMSSGQAVVEHVQVPFNRYSTDPYESGDMALKPVVVDWDGDGDDDIVFTAWQGFFWLLKNQGISNTVNFAAAEQFRQCGGHLALGDSATPEVVDWDNDGDMDLIAGSVSGHIGYFQNIGNRTNPVFVGMVELTNNLGDPVYITPKGKTPIQGPAETMWGYLSCEAWDVDRDNDLDLIINDSLGRLRWIENIGTRSAPVLSSQIHDFIYTNAPVITPWRNRPGVTDLNKDGLVDIFTLDAVGDLVLYRQSGSDPSVLVSRTKMGSTNSSTISINSRTAGPGGRSNIDAGDYDGDGDTELIIVKSRDYLPAGTALLLKNVGSDRSPVFEVGALTARGGSFLEWTGSAGHEQWHNGSPELTDWDGDGKNELLFGVETGRFTLYAPDYFAGTAFPVVELLLVEKRNGQGTEKIILDGSRTMLQELGSKQTPLQILP